MSTDTKAEDYKPDGRGIACPVCKSPRSIVVRTFRGIDKMRRRRRCIQCKSEWITKEETEICSH